MQRGMHLAPLLARAQNDALDQTPDRCRRLVPVLRMLQCVGEPCHLAAVDPGYVRMDVRKIGRGGREAFGELVLAGFQLAQPVRHASHIAAVLDRCDHGRDLLFDRGQLLPVPGARGAALPVEAIGFLGIGPDRLGRRLRRHEAVLQPGQHPFLQNGAADAPSVGAAVGPGMVGAGIPVLAPLHVGAAADAAFEKPRQQVTRPVGRVHRVRMGAPDARNHRRVFLRRLLLPALRRLPEAVVQDAEVRDLGDDPLLPRIDARDLAPGLRVERPALAVPYQTPDIELVV